MVAALFSAISISLTWFMLEETHKKPSGAQNSEHLIDLKGLPGMALLMAFGGFEQLLSLFTLIWLGGVLFQANGGLPFLVWAVMMAILLIIAWVFLKSEAVQMGQENQSREIA